MSKITSQAQSRELVVKIVAAARDKKALKVTVLDMRASSGFCDYFVIASGNSTRQVNAIAGNIDDELSGAGERLLSPLVPNDESGWVVLDYGSVVVHIFSKPVRDFYALERLWSDAKKVRIPAARKKK